MKTPQLKMIIVLRNDLSPALGAVATGHASLGTYLTFQDDLLMQRWQKESFIKWILEAPRDHPIWDYLKKQGPHRVFTESTLDNLEVAIGFNIFEKIPQVFRELPKWGTKWEENARTLRSSITSG
jgi:hypothetical protein